MADWISQYTASLDERDALEKAQKSYIDAYTKLADRTAALEANTAAPPTTAEAAAAAAAAAISSPNPARSGWGIRTPNRAKSPIVNDPSTNRTTSPPPSGTPAAAAAATTSLLARLRADLSTTQHSRTTLSTQLIHSQSLLATATSQAQTSARQTEALTREKRELERRLKDREDELRQKRRLVETVHDELAGLNLELNMAEQKADALRAENDMLVKRWMDRMGMEAEKMNEESKWH